MIDYIGNGAYCYANSAAMLLRTAGEEVGPSQIEVLTGVGLGAFFGGEFLFFSQPVGAPDIGLTRAFHTLGFDVKEGSLPEGSNFPLEELRETLLQGPAILGPLDMGFLTYLPNHPYAAGSDHYVLALALKKEEVVIHDPAGCPWITLPCKQLEKAWRAERIQYRRGVFRYWTQPVRIAKPSQEEIRRIACSQFQEDYRNSLALAREQGSPVGAEAIREAADRLESTGWIEGQWEHLVHFALPLGAKRAMDYGAFFAGMDLELARLKREQARGFGAAHVAAMARDHKQLANRLLELADMEGAFAKALMKFSI
ncbi:hypothetical protein GXN76_04640 [Kroppenstedtia pulmonis]|uniref:BtrH N-terminal domain-containing protein n=1 Tax=Kroppenstedtia pulmonis TaxID=1380685 RepID=A0A7D4BET4_9BACL|nr:hypothetical protein [Kroppenstedtia pulmonis]QKG83832.1 hypothetical protein GXN76_04640 [Kroppenstedtia pulmonis]